MSGDVREVRFTVEAMLPAPETRWRRFWRRLMRRPAPTIQPPGTQTLMVEYRDGDRIVRRYFPAVRADSPLTRLLDDPPSSPDPRTPKRGTP